MELNNQIMIENSTEKSTIMEISKGFNTSQLASFKRRKWHLSFRFGRVIVGTQIASALFLLLQSQDLTVYIG
jgi:hypothetical protein